MGCITRRRLLCGVGGSTVAGPSVAGCLGRGGGPSLESITVGYVPIYPNVQHYVMREEGHYDDVPVDVAVERFSSGPNVVTAFASGDVDVAFFGITPAMVLVDRGTDASVLAANSRNGFKIVARNEVADRYERDGAAAFGGFEDATGRRLRFGAPPDGSVPDVVLRYWIERELDLGDADSAVGKSTIPPAQAVRAMQSGDVDATIVQEPFATIIERDEEFRELAWSGEILESHPVTVLFASERVLENATVAESLVERHVAATEVADTDPEAAASAAASVIDAGVDEELATAAMRSRAADFLSDPREITEQAATMSEYVADAGTIDEPVSTTDLFALDPYDVVHE